MDPRHEALLEHPRQVGPSREACTPANMADQLQRGLRVAVLEILLAQPEAVCPQQQVPSGVRDERYLMDGVGGIAGAIRKPWAG